MPNLSVFSEIGRLRAVAVHSPGLEVDYMTPSLMHQLLFDDILFGKEAREEHRVFSAVLKRVVDRVVDVQDLLAETVRDVIARAHFLDRFCRLHKLGPRDREALEELDSEQLAERAVAGWYEETDGGAGYRFRTPPVPNLLFMRDPAAVIGEGVSINHMATNARRPEPFIMETIFRFHPEFKVGDFDKIWFDMIPGYIQDHPNTNHCLEGGDILVLSKDILAVGVSIRSTQSAVTLLAERLRQSREFKTLFAVLMPQERAVMHLDTIFTQIDEENCLVFPPFFKPHQEHALAVVRMDLTGDAVRVTLKDSFLEALAAEGHKLNPILCGGSNRMNQEREQWTDGANAFCLAPGVIMGYDRNVKTAEELARCGYQLVTGQEIIDRDIDLMDGKRYFIMIKANELSRARGGPRCMTMPLRRDG